VTWYKDDDKIELKLKNYVSETPPLKITDPAQLPLLLEKSKNNALNIPTVKENAIGITDHVFYGCKHYLRSCKILCSICKRFFPCRVCHDKVSDHELNRSETSHVLCFNCLKIVPIAQNCSNCKKSFGCYYCDKCKLIYGSTVTSVYHCDECMF
jgi:uncharacterized CHY-type Zn-finger protein